MRARSLYPAGRGSGSGRNRERIAAATGTGSGEQPGQIQRRPIAGAGTAGAAERRHISSDRRSAAGLARHIMPAYHPERRRMRRRALHGTEYHAANRTPQNSRRAPQNASPEQPPHIVPDCIQLSFYHVTI